MRPVGKESDHEDPIERHLSIRLKELRMERGLSQARVDNMTRRSVAACKMLEQGKSFFGSSELYTLARVFGVDPSCFFDGLPLSKTVSKPNIAPSQDTQMTQETRDLIKAFQHIGDPRLRKTIIGLLNAVAEDPSFVDNIAPFR